MGTLFLFVFLLCVPVAWSAISSVQVVGSTNIQSVLTYEAPDTSPCSVQVSENPDFKPLVHDVNPTLFPGADSDSRSAGLNNGRQRVFVAGRRAVQQGSDKQWYSLALQTDTVHYFRIQCGGDSATGSFRTANLPAGISYPWPFPQDETGATRWPSLDLDPRIIDPNHGTLIRRVSVPGQEAGTNWMRRRFTSATGNNWANPAAALTDDAGSAQFAGATGDWLVLGAANPAFPARTSNESVNAFVVRIKGASPEAAAIEVCLTADGVTCRGEVRSVTLDANESVKTVGAAPADSWGAQLWPDELGAKFGVMIRSRTAASVAIQAVEIDVYNSPMGHLPQGGAFSICSPLLSNGGYHCAWRTSNGAGTQVLYWIHPGTGEVRFLGKIQVTGFGPRPQLCLLTNANFDPADPNVYYCAVTIDNKWFLFKGTYTGSDQAAPPDANAAISWINLTDGVDLKELIREFDPEYDPALFDRCMLDGMAGQRAIIFCRAGAQDSAGWIALFDLGNRQALGLGGTGRIVAAAKSYAAANSRWCGIHGVRALGDEPNWVLLATSQLTGGSEGAGPYLITLTAAVPAMSGRVTIQVAGEPQATRNPPERLMDAQPGDTFVVPGRWDVVRLVQKNSPTEWVVDRMGFYNTSPGPLASGSTLRALCNSMADDPNRSGTVFWNFQADPRAQDTARINWVPETRLTGGHTTTRGNYRIMVDHMGYHVVTPGIPESFNRPDSFVISANPRFNGVRASALAVQTLEGLTNIYQGHPSYENYRASEPGRANWFVDAIPFIGGENLTPALTAVPGFSQLYKTSGARLHRDTFPTFAVCGGRQLKDVSPGPITDDAAYSYCYGANCGSGAAATDVFLNCPPPVSASSRCSSSASHSSVCVADMVPYGQSVTQFFLDPPSRRARVLTNALSAWNNPRTPTQFNTAYPLPDGSWVLFTGHASNARRDVFMVKVPPQPEFLPDPGAFNSPLPVSVTFNPPDDVAQATLEYGPTAALGSSAAFTQCRSGGACSIAVSVRPAELVFARAVFRNASGAVVARSPVQVRISTGILGSGTGKPAVASANIVNAASLEQKLAPGSLITVFGDRLADCAAQVPGDAPLPVSLCNASLLFNGQPAPLLFAGPNQLNALLPNSIPVRQALQVVVKRAETASDAVTLPGTAIVEVAPAIYAYLDGLARRAALVAPDGTVSGPARPLQPGENAALFANALGPSVPPVPDGQVAPADPPALALHPVAVYINDVPQQVLYAGLVPGSTAAWQVNFTVDPATPIHEMDENWIWLTALGTDSPRLRVSLKAP